VEPILKHLTRPSNSIQIEEDQLMEYGGDMDMIVDEKEMAEIDLEWLEEAYHKKELQSLPLEQLCKVHKVYINSTTGETYKSRGGMGIHLDPHKDYQKIPK